MIHVSNLSYTYPNGTQPAIKGLNFDIKEGEIFGFLGPSGAGKSTTQKVLIGLLRDFEGTVEVDGQDLTDITDDYYENIGVSFEIANHYLKLTGLENLQYFSSLYENGPTDLEPFLEMVGLGEDKDTKVSEFSKGMKNRLTFARALVHNPDLLFLDEPTAGLDPVNAEKIMGIIREQQKQGKTIFLTTHDMRVADQLCDRIAFIVDGNISIIETPKQLKLQHGKRSVKVEYGNGAPESQEFALDNLADNTEFLQLLKNNHVQTIHSQEATLEKVFIEVTGRKLQ